MLKWFAPILSFTTEEIYRLLFKDNKSIHLEKFLDFPNSFSNEKLSQKWLDLIKIRNICNISIEGGARAGLIAPDDKNFEYI